MDRDYLGSDYAIWQPPSLDDRRGGADLSALAASAAAQAGDGEEQVLQTNVFKLSQPALAVDDGELLIAWIYDDPNRSSINRTQVVFSQSDGHGWTPPAPIWDDGTADFAPQLAVLPTGQTLCTWENLNRVLPDNAALKDIAAAMDIAVASYDNATRRWNTKALTKDSHLDHTPQIAAGASDTAMLTWAANEKDDILGSDPNAPNTIRYCLWNGGSWLEPGIAATGIKSIRMTTHSTTCPTAASRNRN